MKVTQFLTLFCIFYGFCSTFGFNLVLQTRTRVPPINQAPTPYSRFGSSITYIGKFNTASTGLSNVSEIYAIGASSYGLSSSATVPGPGAVYLFNLNLQGTSDFNPYDSVAIKQYGYTLQNGDQFGASVARLNDADGDGFPELAVGAPGTNSNAGAVYVLFLGAPVQGTTQTSKPTPSVKYIRRIVGPAGSLFGSSLASSIASNSSTDLLVGAPGIAVNGQVQGAFYYYTQLSSSASQTSLSFASSTPLSQSALIGTTFANQGFGTSVVKIGDVNGDGVNDFAFGLPQGTPTQVSSVASGVVYISLMNSSLNAIRTTQFGQANLAAGAQFGASLGRAGDFNHDGVPDFMVGAPGAKGPVGLAGDGIAYMVELTSAGNVLDYAAITCSAFPDCSSQANLGSAVFYREDYTTTTGYPNLILIGGDLKTNGGLNLQGEFWEGNVMVPSPSSTPSASQTPSVSPSATPSVSPSASPSVSSTPSASTSPSASASMSRTPAPHQILPFLWNEKCFRVEDEANCGIGIGPGYAPPPPRNFE